jgi:DNA polymerase-3 subunit epsilon
MVESGRLNIDQIGVQMDKNMITEYTVIDVETPNAKNDSICSIALLRVKGNEVVSREYHLVDPEDYFDQFNVRLHGISKAMVKGSPTFTELWNKINHHFTDGVIVAHNATFDLNVLAKSLIRSRITVPEFRYICTYRLSKSVNGGLRKHGLSSVCEFYGIRLDDHHNALCDAVACQEVYSRLNSVRTVTYADVVASSFSRL